MKIHIITIFPDAFTSFLETSMIKKAIDNNLICINLYKLNDFSDKNFKHVDDKAYGMHGQVISPEPTGKAIEYVLNKIGKHVPVIYMSPSGDIITQAKLEKYYKKLNQEFIILCGHYEGIDYRIIEKYVDYEISIGKYVLTSGELASQVLIDSLSRFIPGVLGNKLSFEEDSYSKKLNRQKEYPVYTRPKVYKNMVVPDVLTSGNPKKIELWKKNNLK